MKVVRAIAVVFLTLVGVASLTCGIWEKTPYDAQFRESPDAPPSRRFPLGTDALGRDRFARLVYGTRLSLLLAPAAALLSCIAAALLGGLAGLGGGIVERAVLAAADLFLSLPWLFLLLIARACLPLNVPAALSVSITFALLGLLGWAGPARVVRAAVLDLRNSDFVLFARASGCTFWRLLWAHLTPNVMPVLRAQFLNRRAGLHSRRNHDGNARPGSLRAAAILGRIVARTRRRGCSISSVAARSRAAAGRGHRKPSASASR